MKARANYFVFLKGDRIGDRFLLFGIILYITTHYRSPRSEKSLILSRRVQNLVNSPEVDFAEILETRSPPDKI
ncbi:hypothetical protein [Spirulina sp. 06S082]|uniref:hypothetical protein n=1 Tax=Spirulina sp. 06S082 TaxID=3110248 RepID=UPI002B20A815|nr:hypothetical protein [Spirulina sp. 06S082]MEA5472440.1 hypothetical protein [Spirulina sp. 06S082]